MNAPAASLLVVDDDRGLTDVLTMALEGAGFEVRAAHDGRAGLAAFEARPPDLVILDLLMPEMDGLELCQRIRAQATTPIVMLTSRAEEMDKVLGLEMGADDYVTKPFSSRELIARVRAALRRVQLERSVDQQPTRDVGALHLDQGRREVLFHGEGITLTATEFDLLWALVDQKGQVLSRDALIDAVYGPDVVVVDRTIDTFVKRVRQKLRDVDSSFAALETVRAVGYRFADHR